MRYAIIFFMLLTTSAFADDRPLTNGDLQTVAVGLASLDGYDRIAKDGGREIVVKEFYKFGKGLRAQIAANIAMLRPVLRQLNDANNELVKQYSEGADKVPARSLPDFTAAQNKLLDQPSAVHLQRIKMDELKLDENNIPAGVLGALDPILDK